MQNSRLVSSHVTRWLIWLNRMTSTLLLAVMMTTKHDKIDFVRFNPSVSRFCLSFGASIIIIVFGLLHVTFVGTRRQHIPSKIIKSDKIFVLWLFHQNYHHYYCYGYFIRSFVAHMIAEQIAIHQKSQLEKNYKIIYHNVGGTKCSREHHTARDEAKCT